MDSLSSNHKEDFKEKEDKLCLYEINESDFLGRYLVASCDIPAQGFIIREKPLVFGPADTELEPVTNSQSDCRQKIPPVCLGCFRRMTQNPDHKCPSCSWPVCSDECAVLPCHSQNECKLFSETGILFPPPTEYLASINKSILVLRCFLLKKERENDQNSNNNNNYYSPSLWNELLKFEHHNNIRGKKKDCIMSDRRVMGNLKYFLKTSSPDEDDLTTKLIENELMKVCGIINVNAFTTVKEDEGGRSGIVIAQCLFLTSSLFSHSCVPNATWAIGPPPNFDMTVRAAIPIRQGEMITIPYSVRDNLYGTLQRMISTEDVAHFTCRCDRCMDPTELSTFVSAIKCSNCPRGYLLPTDSTNPNSVWTCRPIPLLASPSRLEEEENKENKMAEEEEEGGGCDFVLSVNKIVKILHDIENQIENIKRNGGRHLTNSSSSDSSSCSSCSIVCEHLEKLGEKCVKILHKNHYLVQEIRFCIVKKQAIHLKILDQTQRTKFIDHCDCLLKIANVLTPGYCNHRAFLQFYLARALHVHVYAMELELVGMQEAKVDEREGEEEGADDDEEFAGVDRKKKTEEGVFDKKQQTVISMMMLNMLNIYQRILILEKEARLFFQTEFDTTTTSNPEDSPVTSQRPYYFDKLCSRISLTQQRIRELEYLGCQRAGPHDDKKLISSSLKIK